VGLAGASVDFGWRLAPGNAFARRPVGILPLVCTADGESQCEASQGEMTQPAIHDVICSFCGRRTEEVARILAGPNIEICDDFTVLAAEFAGEGRPDWCNSLG
jgi:hypothetical protein